MIRVADFVHAFEAGPDTLCCEVVLAFLRASGRVAGDIPRAEQRALFAHWGALRALQICGKRLGFRLEPPGALGEGDAVLLRAAAIGVPHVCGLVGEGGAAVFVKAGDGTAIATAFEAMRVARFG